MGFAPGGVAVGTGVVRFVAHRLASLLVLLAGIAGVSAEEFRTPAVSLVRVDWRAALDRLRSEIGTQPTVTPSFTFSGRRRLPGFDPRSMPALVQLNAVTSKFFTGIGRSPVPVLLPFDTAAFLGAQSSGAPAGPSRFQADFRPVDVFDAGQAGYDAVFSLEPGVGDGMPQRTFARPVEVQITGSILVYEINDPQGGKGEPVKSLASQFPDLRRFIREGYVRYAFTRFGVPYVVSIQCLDSSPRPRRLACREAYPVAERFLKALHVAGGLPSRARMDAASEVVERPLAASSDFTYRAAGDIIARSGSRKQGGRADFTAYSQIRFPLEETPAFIHSQSFGKRRLASELAGGPTSYPWQDNFCEARSFSVGQCPSGFGHQGEDIRAAACPPQSDGPDRCDPKQKGVVAVRDAVVIRSPKQQAATLQVNTRTEHIRFRYMHMNPFALDADRILNGREVAEGEKIGVVSNYLDRPNGTTRHLHFDVQVFTRDGWLWVNPYVTLISAYERLIRGRGREIGPPAMPSSADVAHAMPQDAIRPGIGEGGEN
ncbi:MAG TPA: M23 family peptidase [Bradyrhizobium sp.]|nr:M23 family peptidase [Bradyrhizobium sp.]